jgi:hypothetical protein
MALIDTALDTVKVALDEVTEVASESLETVGEALGDLVSEERSRKRLVVFLILAVLIFFGVLAFKKTRAKAGAGKSQSDGQTADLYTAASR